MQISSCRTASFVPLVPCLFFNFQTSIFWTCHQAQNRILLSNIPEFTYSHMLSELTAVGICISATILSLKLLLQCVLMPHEYIYIYLIKRVIIFPQRKVRHPCFYICSDVKFCSLCNYSLFCLNGPIVELHNSHLKHQCILGDRVTIPAVSMLPQFVMKILWW